MFENLYNVRHEIARCLRVIIIFGSETFSSQIRINVLYVSTIFNFGHKIQFHVAFFIFFREWYEVISYNYL